MSLIEKINTYSLGTMGISVFFIIIGFLGLIWCGHFYLFSIEVKAIVVGFEKKVSDNKVSYLSKFKFIAADGNDYVVMSTIAFNPPRHKNGESITIRYKKTDPMSAKPSDFFSLWDLPIMFGGGGTFLFLMGFVVERITMRMKRRAEQPGAL